MRSKLSILFILFLTLSQNSKLYAYYATTYYDSTCNLNWSVSETDFFCTNDNIGAYSYDTTINAFNTVYLVKLYCSSRSHSSGTTLYSVSSSCEINYFKSLNETNCKCVLIDDINNCDTSINDLVDGICIPKCINEEARNIVTRVCEPLPDCPTGTIRFNDGSCNVPCESWQIQTDTSCVDNPCPYVDMQRDILGDCAYTTDCTFPNKRISGICYSPNGSSIYTIDGGTDNGGTTVKETPNDDGSTTTSTITVDPIGGGLISDNVTIGSDGSVTTDTGVPYVEPTSEINYIVNDCSTKSCPKYEYCDLITKKCIDIVCGRGFYLDKNENCQPIETPPISPTCDDIYLLAIEDCGSKEKIAFFNCQDKVSDITGLLEVYTVNYECVDKCNTPNDYLRVGVPFAYCNTTTLNSLDEFAQYNIVSALWVSCDSACWLKYDEVTNLNDEANKNNYDPNATTVNVDMSITNNRLSDIDNAVKSLQKEQHGDLDAIKKAIDKSRINRKLDLKRAISESDLLTNNKFNSKMDEIKNAILAQDNTTSSDYTNFMDFIPNKNSDVDSLNTAFDNFSSNDNNSSSGLLSLITDSINSVSNMQFQIDDAINKFTNPDYATQSIKLGSCSSSFIIYGKEFRPYEYLAPILENFRSIIYLSTYITGLILIIKIAFVMLFMGGL